MLYRLRIKNSRSRKSYVFESAWPEPLDSPGAISIADYEYKFTEVKSPVTGLIIEHLAQPVDPNLFSPIIKVNTKPKGNDAFSPDFVLDQSYGQFAIVTQAFKDLVERLDPGLHQFVPCKLQWDDGTVVETAPMYHFICGRIVSFNTAGVAGWSAPGPIGKKYFMLKPDERKLIPALLQRSDYYEALEQFPIWTFKRGRAEKYISQQLLDEAKAKDLKGFELSDKKVVRDVQPVVDIS